MNILTDKKYDLYSFVKDRSIFDRTLTKFVIKFEGEETSLAIIAATFDCSSTEGSRKIPEKDGFMEIYPLELKGNSLTITGTHTMGLIDAVWEESYIISRKLKTKVKFHEACLKNYLKSGLEEITLLAFYISPPESDAIEWQNTYDVGFEYSVEQENLIDGSTDSFTGIKDSLSRNLSNKEVLGETLKWLMNKH